MHAVEYGYNLDSFDNIWQNNSVGNITQDLRNTDRFILPFMRIEQSRKFSICFPKVWNDLKDVRLQRNRTTFKIAFIDELFETVSETNLKYLGLHSAAKESPIATYNSITYPNPKPTTHSR
jgi:hypothetical protein